jgi:hypothetical protein
LEFLQGFKSGRTESSDLITERAGTRSSDCVAIAVKKFLKDDDLWINGALREKFGDEGCGCREAAA